MDDDTSNTDVMEADSPTQMEALAARRRDRSLSLTLSNVSSRAAFSDDGFCFSDFLGSGDDSDIEMDLLPWPEEEVAEEPRGRSPAREPSPSERSESPALPAKTSLDLAPPAKKPNLKPFSIVDESGRTIRMVHMTEFGPKIIDYGESGPVTVFDTPADLGATNKQKGNALVLGMFYCDPKCFGTQQIGSAAIRDSIRLISLERDYNVYSVDREHGTRDALDKRHFKIDLSNGSRAARSLKKELAERNLEGLKFSVVIGDYFRLPADCLNRLYTRSLFLKFFTAMYDEDLLMADSRLYMPNAVRIRENLDGLNGLYRMKAIPGMDNPLYEATERAPLPDGYTNKGETRALDDARPFLLLTFLESALEVTTKKGLSLERTFSAKLANSQGAGKAGAAKVLISIGNSPDRPRSTDQGKAKESDKQKEKQYQKPSDKDKDSEEKKRQRLKELEKEQRRRESQSQEAFRNGQKGSRPLTASGHG